MDRASEADFVPSWALCLQFWKQPPGDSLVMAFRIQMIRLPPETKLILGFVSFLCCMFPFVLHFCTL